MIYVSMKKFPETRIEFTSALYTREYNTVLNGHTVDDYIPTQYAFESIVCEASKGINKVLENKAYKLKQALYRKWA